MPDEETLAEAFRGFDPNSAEFAADPWASFSELRDACPVFHSDQVGWVIAGHPELYEAARDHERFRSDWGPKSPSPSNLPRIHEEDGETGFSYAEFPVLPIETDPPVHTAYRKIMQSMFTGPAIEAAFGDDIRSLAAKLIREYIQAGGGDYVEQVAYPMSGLALATVLGIEPERRTEFQEKALKVASEIGPVLEFLSEVIESARTGAFERLRNATFDGRRLTDKEKLGYGIILIHAGWETTAGTLTTMMYRLATQPDLRSELQGHPELISGAVEEFLRIDGSVLGLWRTVAEDTSLAGCPMRKGDKALFLFGGANRDPREFERPDEVIPDRKPNHHVALGLGVHRCLGAPLVRAEMRAVLSELLQAPAFVLDNAAPIVRSSGAVAAIHSMSFNLAP